MKVAVAAMTAGKSEILYIISGHRFCLLANIEEDNKCTDRFHLRNFTIRMGMYQGE